jgi:PAS domain S-box-containing protein
MEPDVEDNQDQAASAELRRRAEECLHATESRTDNPRTDVETLRLLHELQVHRIELEMQNAELRKARDEVEATLEKYSELYEFAPVGYLTLDRNGTIHVANFTAATLLGLERSRLIGRRFGEYVANGFRPTFAAFLNAIFTDRPQVSYEVELSTTMHPPRIVQLEALLSASGKECRVAIIDITERKRTETALRNSEKLYRAIGETIDYGIWVCDPDGRNIYASKSFLRMVGMTQQQCSDFGWSGALDPDDVERTLAAWRECVRTEGNWNIEHRYLGADGHCHPVLARGIPVKNDQGEIIYWAGINLDISGIKQIEEELSREKSRLAEAQWIAHVGSWQWDPFTDVITGSAEFYRIFGGDFTSYEDFLNRVHPDDRDDVNKAIRRDCDNLSVDELHYRIVCPDGDIRFIHARRQAVCDDTGMVTLMNGTVQDVTANMVIEEALAANQRELEAMNRSLKSRVREAVADVRQRDQLLIIQERMALMGEMINNIAHQWRQPLNSLGLVIQQLPVFFDSGRLNGEFLKKNSATAMELIQHMSRTIDDFRNFFRSDKKRETFPLQRIVNNTLSLVGKGFEDQRIVISLQQEGNPLVNGYPNEYAQVLLNILLNARDALITHQGDDPGITIRTFTEGGMSVMTVTDNAGGISDQIINKLFEPYFTTKGPDKGSGIGLFMSKTIIEKNMGGRLTVRNTGSGAEFRIEVANADN